MRKYKSAYLKPYIRRLRKSDKGADLRNDIRIITADVLGYRYVMVQRGSNLVTDIGKTKHEIKQHLLAVRTNRDYNKWANRMKHYCQK